MMRRLVATLVLGTLAALIWAPLTVSGAGSSSPIAPASPTATATASPAASSMPIFSAPPLASANLLVEPYPSATAGDPAPTATAAVAAPSSATGVAPTPAPASGSGGGTVAAATGAPQVTSASTTPGDTAPRASSAPGGTPAERAPVTSPGGSAVAGAAAGPAATLPGDRSQTLLLTLIGVAAIAAFGVFFMLLGRQRRDIHDELVALAAAETSARERRGSKREDPAEVLARAAAAAMAARTVRRGRIRAADDPILRGMGLGSDDPEPPTGPDQPVRRRPRVPPAREG